MSCPSICPTTIQAENIHVGLLMAQAVPVVGILPAIVQTIFSIDEWLASWMTSEGATHRELAISGLVLGGANTITFGFGFPLFLLCEGEFYSSVYKEHFFSSENH